MTDNSFIRDCPICGKPFYCDNVEMWVYKKAYKNRETGKLSKGHIKVFCSYHCFREWQKGGKNGKI